MAKILTYQPSGSPANPSRDWFSRLPKVSVVEYIMILVALTGLFVFVFGSTFKAQFELIDDHQILRSASENFSVRDVIEIATTADLSIGRFRPVFYFFYYAEVALFGTNPVPWHLVVTGLGVFTCFLFYLAVRRVGLDVLSSLLFVLLLAVAGSPDTIWYRLGTGETLGTFFVAVSVWAIANAAYQGSMGLWDVLALATMALAGLTKESFVLVMPALLLLRWLLHCWFHQVTWQVAWYKVRLPLALGLLVFVLESLVVAGVLMLKPEGYGAGVVGLSLKSFDPRVWYTVLVSSDLVALVRYLPLLGVLILALRWRSRQARLYILAGLLVCVTWITPQLILYSRGIGGHYLFPAVVSIAAAIAFSLAVVWRRAWLLWVVCVALLLPVLGNGLRTTAQAASAFTARTLALQEMVSYLAQNIGAEQSIVIIADPALNYERIYSLRVHLRFAGSQSPVYLFPVFPVQGYTDSRSRDLSSGIIAQYPDLNTLDIKGVGGVILLSPFTGSNEMPAWLISSLWEEKDFRKSYYDFSFQKPVFGSIHSTGYTVLVPSSNGSLAAPSESPIITLEVALKEKASISPLVRLPPWGIEEGDDGGARVWLGQGTNQGVGGVIWATQNQAVQAILQVQPGPARPDSQRTIEATLQNDAGVQQARQQFNGATELVFVGELQPGRNDFQFSVLDEATVMKQPNGDTRPLLVLLHQISIKPLGED